MQITEFKDTYKEYFPVGDGWRPLVEKLVDDIIAVDPEVEVSQVKEKFGTLRFYYEGGDEYINGLVSMAESMSEVTCEVCGNPGKRRAGGWIKTLCDRHHEEREALRAGNGTP